MFSSERSTHHSTLQNVLLIVLNTHRFALSQKVLILFPKKKFLNAPLKDHLNAHRSVSSSCCSSRIVPLKDIQMSNNSTHDKYFPFRVLFSSDLLLVLTAFSFSLLLFVPLLVILLGLLKTYSICRMSMNKDYHKERVVSHHLAPHCFQARCYTLLLQNSSSSCFPYY